MGPLPPAQAWGGVTASQGRAPALHGLSCPPSGSYLQIPCELPPPPPPSPQELGPSGFGIEGFPWKVRKPVWYCPHHGESRQVWSPTPNSSSKTADPQE